MVNNPLLVNFELVTQRSHDPIDSLVAGRPAVHHVSVASADLRPWHYAIHCEPLSTELSYPVDSEPEGHIVLEGRTSIKAGADSPHWPIIEFRSPSTEPKRLQVSVATLAKRDYVGAYDPVDLMMVEVPCSPS